MFQELVDLLVSAAAKPTSASSDDASSVAPLLVERPGTPAGAAARPSWPSQARSVSPTTATGHRPKAPAQRDRRRASALSSACAQVHVCQVPGPFRGSRDGPDRTLA